MPVKKGRKSVKTDDNTIGTTDTDLTTNDTNSDDVPKIKPVINALFKQKKVREAKSTDFENTDDDEKLKNIKGKKRETFADRKKDESKGKKSKKRKETTVQATNIETVQEVEEEVPIEPLDVTAEDVEAIFNTVSTGEAPIDISIDYENFGQVTMSSLQWSNLAAVPVALKLTNTSHSLVITGKWPVAEMPYISGGPLLEDYVFSQIHYHWGGVVRQYDIEQKKDTLWIMAGSEHTIENEQTLLKTIILI
ncbi:hypothetical protein O3M35_010378 [Rhynocoris fuscipes]|uniref:Alpha-carbonic anhydrase domain-containing protein n=1 Tax=Rhynocoris fuscipes TaxID=488301 RepID=A0AAW1D5R1_9HEMI